MRDRASLIEEHITWFELLCLHPATRRPPGRRRSRPGLPRTRGFPVAPAPGGRRCVRGWLYTILYNRFLTDKHGQPRRGVADALLEVAETDAARIIPPRRHRSVQNSDETSKPLPVSCGTESSNPFPSSGESCELSVPERLDGFYQGDAPRPRTASSTPSLQR